MAEIRTAVTIPPRATPLHRILELHSIQAAILTNNPHSKAELLTTLERLRQRNLIQESALAEIEAADERQLLIAIEDVMRGEQPANDVELKHQELRALSIAANEGYPRTPTGIPNFEVDQNKVRLIQVSPDLTLRVCPISRLRVVMVQVGYRRLKPQNDHLVYRSIRVHERTWYPGVEHFGEGVYLDIPDKDQARRLAVQLRETSIGIKWKQAHQDPSSFGFAPGALDDYQLHPSFVWWHSMSHRLINAISIDSGYNSASIRERVYLDDAPEPDGGLLIYTAQPGGDGTLGGLIGLVPHFETVLQTALLDLHSCSNDPLCEEEAFTANRANGSACYACLFLSETSCEHRNMFLDRGLLRAAI